MEYGCIGEVLKHSFSKQIHNILANYNYELMELSQDKVGDFLKEADFKAINVTIPYKEMVIPYLTHIDKEAKLIGAVNTIVNRGGELYGYNTDFYGMCMLAQHAGIDFYGKKVLILGTGGTSKTAYAVATYLGACEVVKVTRKRSSDAITYEECQTKHIDSDIIINTTPVGMFPKILGKPIELSKFTKLSGVLDAVYNPISTPLILEARQRGIAAEGGLYMLVAQAVKASEIFTGKNFEPGTLDRVFSEIERKNKNIVLIGMPTCGKTTVGKLIANSLAREVLDTDSLIEKRYGIPIPQIFSKRGEHAFRDAESSAILIAAAEGGKVISVGGGTVLRRENVEALRENGKIYFIDRPLRDLVPSDDRPLSSTREDIEKRYNERYELYIKSCDVRIDASCSAEEVSRLIINDFCAEQQEKSN